MSDILASLAACIAGTVTPEDRDAITLEACAEIARLRLAIRRLADQDATLSACDGNVTVTLDATLTDAEREAISDAAYLCRATAGLASEQANATAWATCAATLHGLVERLGGAE